MNMYRKNPDVDVINEILKLTLDANPASEFTQSLLHQYQERGGLSKKQLQGLYSKASKINTMPASKLATLEAVILKMPTRYKSALPPTTPLYNKDEAAGKLITAILEKYPQHKRVLFLKTKYDNNKVLSSSELTELQKFYKMLI
jgi:DNA repair protein RadC